MTGYFITSTDTNAGKTTAALCLMKHIKSHGKSVGCMKPVSAGCDKTPDGLRNDDALQLMQEASIDLPYEWVNPYAFEPPIAPHIAAQQASVHIDTKIISDRYQDICSKSNVVIVEGAGGWLVPINDHQTMADVARTLNLPIILVVGLRLGCLNHALLTTDNIVQGGYAFSGWISNYIDSNMLAQEKNIEALEAMIPAPHIGSISFEENISKRTLETSSVFAI